MRELKLYSETLQCNGRFTYPSCDMTSAPIYTNRQPNQLTWKDPSIWTSCIASSTPSRTCRRPRNSLPSCIKSATLWRPSLTYSCSWKAMRAIASDLFNFSPLANLFCARNPKLARRSLSCVMHWSVMIYAFGQHRLRTCSLGRRCIAGSDHSCIVRLRLLTLRY